jgi:3-oxoacyl-[acyl-carrier protein] reductase
LFALSLLADRIALVTGSTAGIGAATADQLAGAGARVVILNGRTESTGREVQARLQAKHPHTSFEFMAADYNNPEEAQLLFERIAATYGGLDIFIHTCIVRGGVPKPFMETNRPYWRDAVNGIFLSLVECCKHAVPLMIRRGGGAIVSFASDAAKIATPGEAVTGACIAANVMFTRTLALEVARYKIRANIVTPSITKGTTTYDIVMANEYSRKLFEKAEKRARLGVPYAEHVAPAAVFLASPLASHITGQALSVNGGISAA